jgi:hypothetical protein
MEKFVAERTAGWRRRTAMNAFWEQRDIAARVKSAKAISKIA